MLERLGASVTAAPGAGGVGRIGEATQREPRRPPRTVAFPMHDWKPPRVLSRGTTYVLKGSLQLLGGEHTAGVKGRNSETS